MITRVLAILTLLLVACSDQTTLDTAEAADTARSVLAEGEEVDSFDRISAAGVLLSAGSGEAEDVIIEALTSGAILAQQAAVGALLGVPGKDPIRRIELFAGESAENLHGTLQALRWAPRADARAFVQLGLADSQAGTQVAAFDFAALLTGDTALLPEIVAAINRTDEEHVRGYGIYAASALGSPDAFLMIEPLLDGKVFEREIAAACLGFIQSEESRAALNVLLEDFQPGVRLAAWASLSRFGHEHAADELFAALEQPDLAGLAAGAIRRASPATIEEISERAGDWSGINTSAAGRVLEAIGWAPEANASQGLANALADGQDELLKLQSLWAVGWRGKAEERPLATAQLGAATSAIRTMAAWAVVVNQHGGYKIGEAALQ